MMVILSLENITVRYVDYSYVVLVRVRTRTRPYLGRPVVLFFARTEDIIAHTKNS